MKEKPTITYIKNGQEKTININFWNKSKILNEIFKNYNQYIFINKELEIKEDIEYVHFKNIKIDASGIECENENTICILDECTISTTDEITNSFEIFDGYFEFINPKFINTLELYSSYVTDLNFILNKQNLKEKSIEDLKLSITDAQNISLEGNFNLTELILSGKTIKLGTDTSLTNIIASSEIYIRSSDNLEIKRCIIENNSEIYNTEIEYENIEIDNYSSIKSKKRIVKNLESYTKKDKEEYIILTVKELKRENLISILKGYKNILNTIIDTRKKKYIENEFVDLKQEIKKEEDNLKNLRQQLNNQTKEKEKQIVKSLSKKRITYFDK